MTQRTLGFLLLAVPWLALPVPSQQRTPVPPGTLLDATDLLFVGRTNPRDHILIEGDIMVPRVQGPLGTYILRLWPAGVVPFTFDSNVSTQNRGWAQAAMDEWQRVANVVFRPRISGDMAGIHFVDSTENSSFVGRVFFGGLPASQNVNIRDWGDHFVVVHELGHALGFWHEQSRVDRDQYVRIQTANIQAGQEHNFAIQSNSRRYGPYDFDSTMHYGSCFFTACSPCCPTITVLPQYAAWQNVIGQQNHLSRMDGVVMSFLYPDPSWRFVDPAHTGTQSGTFLEPHRNLAAGISAVPDRGTMWVAPGTYSAVGTYRRPMTIAAPPHGPYAPWHGGVVLGR